MAPKLSDVYTRMKDIFAPNRKSYNPAQFRFTLMGIVLCCTINEVLSYMLLHRSVEVGELPPGFIDLVFGSISLATVIIAPLLSWVGGRRRITTMCSWLAPSLLFIVPLFFLPQPARQLSELCNAGRPGFEAFSALTIFRLVTIICLAVVNSLGFVVLCAHGIAISDRRSPKTVCMDLAVIMGFRVLIMMVGYEVMYEFVENRLWLQLMAVTPHPIISIVMLRRNHWQENGVDDDDEAPGFLSSLISVVSNRRAMLHTLVMGFLVTVLWAIASNDYEIAKSKYYATWSFNSSNNLVAFVRAFVIVLFIKLNGYDFSSPVMTMFDKSLASKTTVRQTARGLIGLIILALLNCNKSPIMGLNESEYASPSCSIGCGCQSPASNFNPVCMLDSMTTYFSPCHAGCASTTDFNNVTLYTGCRCSASGRADLGACGSADCDAKYAAHQLLFSFIVAFILTATMLQFVLVLRAVRATEKDVAIGVSFSLSYLLAFVGGHAGSKALALNTCLYWDSGRCQLLSATHGSVVYYMSVGILGLVILFNLVMWWLYRRERKAEKTEIELNDIDNGFVH